MKFLYRILVLMFVLSGICLSQNKPAVKREEKSSEKSAAPVTVKTNILVTDAAGKLANDLKIEDFKIYENGAEQKITHFARKENALNIGLVVDNTGSLRMQLDVEIMFGKALVKLLRAPRDEVFVARFVSTDKIQVVQDWTADKNRLDAALDNLFVEGGASAVIDAVYLSAEKLLEREKADKTKRSAIVLITDGEDRDSFHRLEETLALFKQSDAQIFVVALQRDLSDEGYAASGGKTVKKKAANFVQRLALETGGAAYIFDKKYTLDDLNAAFKSLAAELGSQYIIGYTPANQNRDGAARKLAVQIADGAKGEKRQALIRADFTVPKN